jgi:hypothetical protein
MSAACSEGGKRWTLETKKIRKKIRFVYRMAGNAACSFSDKRT